MKDAISGFFLGWTLFGLLNSHSLIGKQIGKKPSAPPPPILRCESAIQLLDQNTKTTEQCLQALESLKQQIGEM